MPHLLALAKEWAICDSRQYNMLQMTGSAARRSRAGSRPACTVSLAAVAAAAAAAMPQTSCGASASRTMHRRRCCRAGRRATTAAPSAARRRCVNNGVPGDVARILACASFCHPLGHCCNCCNEPSAAFAACCCSRMHQLLQALTGSGVASLQVTGRASGDFGAQAHAHGSPYGSPPCSSPAHRRDMNNYSPGTSMHMLQSDLRKVALTDGAGLGVCLLKG